MNAVDAMAATNTAAAEPTVFADVAQNTPDWHDWRRFQCTASDAPIVMNAAPDYWETRTWNELRERRHAEAMGEPVDPAKIFLERAHGAGHALEPFARDWFSAETGARLAPACASRVVAGVPLAASFDAVDPALRLHAEVKTAAGPKSRINRLVDDPAAFDDPVFDYVRWQLVHHHAVLDDAADWHFHVVVAGLDAGGKRVFGAVPVDAAELAERTAELVERWRRSSTARTRSASTPPGATPRGTGSPRTTTPRRRGSAWTTPSGASWHSPRRTTTRCTCSRGSG